jgi:hypothetical protein
MNLKALGSKNKVNTNQKMGVLGQCDNHYTVETCPNQKMGKKIIKIWTEINDMEAKRVIQRINETKSWFFEKINELG